MKLALYTTRILKFTFTKGASLFYVGLLTALFFSSCHSYKKIVYFRDLPDSIYKAPLVTDNSSYIDPVIQSNDILDITIQTLDPQLSGIPGTSALSSSASSLSTTLSTMSGAAQPGSSDKGYLVDKDGMVEIPLAGKIKVGGLTTAEARDTIDRIASTYFINPVVNVRFENFKITVIGEVNKPAQYLVQGEKASIIDAIGMAGDLTIYGKRDNILLIRNLKRKREFIRFDLNSSDVFQSPYFYLRQGDVVYVEPNKAKAAITDAASQRNVAYVTSALTIIVVIVSDIIFR